MLFTLLLIICDYTGQEPGFYAHRYAFITTT